MASPAPKIQQEVQEIPLQMVGGNQFGRYSKISLEETYNFIISDGFLVPYAGYAKVLTENPNQPGRGIYTSSRENIIIAVWGSEVFSIDKYLNASFIGNLTTNTGDVYISENNGFQIVITDGQHLYVYNYHNLTTPLLLQSGVNFMIGTFPINNPGYISFQNGRFLVADTSTTLWYLSGFNDGTVWGVGSNQVGTLQTKPDLCQACVPVPGAGNNLLVFGKTVIELWVDVGAALFPYQRNSSFNIDYGCLNPSSIAALDNYVVWLAANEQSGATLMVFSGNKVQSITTDGMDFKLADLSNPSNCTGFLFRQDGHLLYQFTFLDDNLSYVWDFESQKFFTVTDEHLNYHIARNVVFFNNQYYFVSLKGGNLYQFGTQFTDFVYSDNDIVAIPRIRICPPIRLPSQRMFIVKSLGFTLENGQPNTIAIQNFPLNSELLITQTGNFIITQNGNYLVTQNYDPNVVPNTYTQTSEAIFLSVSRDGGETFGSSEQQSMNPVGKRKSRVIFQRLGQANDFTPQIRFYGFGRFVVTDGVVEVYQ